ncbi:MAG: hypothetical protein WD057_03275 [Aquisalimonadaceae bacterium]
MQTVVEHRDQLALEHRVNVNQQVSTSEQVELGKGGVKHHIMLGEKHHVAGMGIHPVMSLVKREKTGQPRRRDAVADGQRIVAVTRGRDGVRAQIGCEYLQVDRL